MSERQVLFLPNSYFFKSLMKPLATLVGVLSPYSLCTIQSILGAVSNVFCGVDFCSRKMIWELHDEKQPTICPDHPHLGALSQVVSSSALSKLGSRSH